MGMGMGMSMCFLCFSSIDCRDHIHLMCFANVTHENNLLLYAVIFRTYTYARVDGMTVIGTTADCENFDDLIAHTEAWSFVKNRQIFDSFFLLFSSDMIDKEL